MLLKKIKILYLIDCLYNQGGSEMYLCRLLMNLDRKRFLPIICPLEPFDSLMIQKLRNLAIPLYPLGVNKIYSWQAIKKGLWLKKLIKQEKVDIVQTIHFSSDFLGIIAGRLAGVSAVISSRRDMGFMETSIHYRFFRYLLDRLTDRVLTNSNMMQQAIVAAEKIPAIKFITIYNGVCLDEFKPMRNRSRKCLELGLRPDSHHIGIIANIRPIKGLEFFLLAAAETLNVFPNCEFVIIGSTASLHESIAVYWQKLCGIIDSHGIKDKIIFLGPRQDIADVLTLLDVYVCSSISEGFSNSIIEAMACGVPVIATKVGGNVEAVCENQTGFLVPPKDAKAIAVRLIQLLADRKRRRSMGNAARQRVADCFNLPNVVREHEMLYASLSNKKNKMPKKPTQ